MRRKAVALSGSVSDLRRVVFVGAAVAALGVFSLFAQAPADGGAQAASHDSTSIGGGQGPPPDPAGRGRAGGGQGRGSSQIEPDFSPKPAVVPLTPEEEAKRFWLPPGFALEPVLTDPHIQEPGQIAFDGNGRMYVVELRGYMQDADGGGTLDPVGRISWHEDRDGNGVYETHGTFVDKLVFPRFVLPFGRGVVLTKESNADEVWKYVDTNSDGTADRKELFTTGLGRLANVEHQESGFIWAMDNWIYSTFNQQRVRWTPTGVLKEPTGPNQGAWGVTQDNNGKVWFQQGFSGMPGYFQLPVAYGYFNHPEQFEPDLNITWGAPVLVADMQGGMGAVRMPDGSLARATGAAGNDIFRGDRLPRDMVGDYFYGEVVARIVRRLRPVKDEGLTQLRNVYPLSEFIRSTDPLFRPVDMTTAPDGTLYITDMYRGIIQESQWSGPETYLRRRIEQYQLDKVVRHGRVWRLTYSGMPRDTTQPHMHDETPAQLVAHLSHPNGWWRDTAQQLLVLKQDRSIVPTLRRLARTSSNQLARFHALWTLEGLGSIDAALVRELMKSSDPQTRVQAIRASETLYKAGDQSFAVDYKAMATDAGIDVALQALLTLNTLKVPEAAATIRATAEANKARGVQLVAKTIADPSVAGTIIAPSSTPPPPRTPVEEALLARGRTIYTELCFTCHGDNARGTPRPGGTGTMAPPLAGSERVTGHPDYVIKVLLHGLSGPVNGVEYTEVMIPMGQQNDEWIAAIASYIRNAFDNRAPVVSQEEVARVRQATASRRAIWTNPELEASLPKLLLVDSGWRFTASHNSAIAHYAPTIQPWSSGVPQ
jgi:mono/diheme cytochrome c family protein/glucose/arabinose dehydrogenase